MNKDDQIPTALSLPSSLPYPITISKLLLRPGDQVTRGQRIMSYTYVLEEMESVLVDSDGEEIRKGSSKEGTRKLKKKRTRIGGSWDCSVEGEFLQWETGVQEGMVIKQGGGNFLHVLETCVHPMVFAGLCAVCGKDLTAQHDYMDIPNPGGSSTAFGGSSEFEGSGNEDGNPARGLRIDHDDSRVTVNAAEAHRLALTHRRHLLTNRKLILVIDLDQTVIHAAVDPTIGEWLEECGMGESSKIQVPPKSSAPKSGSRGKSKAEESEQDDGMDLKNGEEEGDASKKKSKGKGKATANPNFEALQDVFRFQLPDELPSGIKGQSKKTAEIDPNSCWYYVKPRPGLSTFLESMTTMYELHVYTAGSRTYANAVCKGIDPDGRFFGERILSRDESGNIAVKSLKRLFPTDQSMVVVIDDRNEVWNYAPNLLKVVPYDFFVGMGDINAAFVVPRSSDSDPTTAGAVASSSETLLVPDEDIIAMKQTSDIESQLEDRPLAKQQADLEKATEEAASGESSPGDVESPEGESPRRQRALLKATDDEMNRLDLLLREVHGRFYISFSQSNEDFRIAPSANPDPRIMFDVRHIIPHMKRKILAGCVLVFSGMIPQDQRPEESEFWILAKAFGAKCMRNLGPDVTHLVTTQADTQKAHQAFRTPGVKVVWKKWLQHSLDVWYRQPSGPYLVHPPKAKSPSDPQSEAPESTTPPGDPADMEGDATADVEMDAIGEDSGEFEDEMKILQRSEPVVLDLDDADFEAELAKEMEEDSSEDGESVNGSTSATPSKKRSRPESLIDSPDASPRAFREDDDKPFKKRARFADEEGEMASEFADVEVERDEEDYDEYDDEDGDHNVIIQSEQ